MVLCFWLLLLVKYNHLINTVEINYYDDVLSALSLVGRTRSWGRFLFITTKRSCLLLWKCCNLDDLHIYKGCVLLRWMRLCYRYMLFCLIASINLVKTLLKTYQYFCIIKNRKYAVSKTYELFELHYVWLYIHLYIWQISNFLSPPVQFVLIVLQHSMEQFISLPLSHNLEKCNSLHI